MSARGNARRRAVQLEMFAEPEPVQSPPARKVGDMLRVAHEALADLERKTAAKAARTTKRGRA